MPRLYDEEPRSIFVFPNVFRLLSHKARQIGVYSAGVLVNEGKGHLHGVLFLCTSLTIGSFYYKVCFWLVGFY